MIKRRCKEMSGEDWACLLFIFILSPCTFLSLCWFLSPIPSWIAVPCFIVTVVGWILVVVFFPELDSQNMVE